ncbi:MAG: hypothetical protein KME46_06275 [Brasilonema angustatum HA4187-MV1]|nr:hypothetical protein [Brasilonema angustatum HA4187-MV1]
MRVYIFALLLRSLIVGFTALFHHIHAAQNKYLNNRVEQDYQGIKRLV